MKNLLLTSLIILFCACSTDDTTYADMQLAQKNTALESLGLRADLGPYLKSESSTGIKAGEHILIVREKIADQILSVISPDHSKGTTKLLSQRSSGDTILMEMDPVQALYLIVEESSLNIELQQNVKNYIFNLNDLQGQTDIVIDNYIIAYEISKRTDPLLEVAEKETILTLSSLSEATLYADKTRKDRDWETSTASKKVR